MKQFMTLSAFLLSAACLCVHTQSFAATQSATNQMEQGAGNVASGAVKGTKNVLQGAGQAIEGAAKGIGQATKRGVQSIEKGTKNLLGDKNNNNNSNH